MERYSTVITVLAVCLTALTLMFVLTMGHDDNVKKNIYEGLLMLACLFAFTAFVITRESAGEKA